MKFLACLVVVLFAAATLAKVRAADASSTATPANELNGFQNTGPGITQGKIEIVRPDESWIDHAGATDIFMPVTSLRDAWTNKSPSGAEQISEELPNADQSLLSVTTPEQLWKQLDGLKGDKTLQLAVTLKQEEVPGGYGLNPLAARSVYGTALLFGIGGVDTGIGSFQHQRLVGVLDHAGVFEPGTKFIPFWSQAAFYDARSSAGADGADYNELFTGKPGEPLFGHSAPGVLVSGYQTKNGLLLVVVNYTNQTLGKLGDVWVDIPQFFGRQAYQVSNPETGQALPLRYYNRKAGGFARNMIFNIAIAPGDYGLILLEPAS